jgi:hypothetical protein
MLTTTQKDDNAFNQATLTYIPLRGVVCVDNLGKTSPVDVSVESLLDATPYPSQKPPHQAATTSCDPFLASDVDRQHGDVTKEGRKHTRQRLREPDGRTAWHTACWPCRHYFGGVWLPLLKFSPGHIKRLTFK